MSWIKQYKSFSQSKPWTARIFLTLLIIVIFLSLIRISLPFVIQLGAAHWFESRNIEARVGDIELSLLDGTFSINNVSGENKAGKGFSLGYFGVAWQWKPLFDHQAVVDLIEIRSLSADADFFDDGDMNIAGVEIKATDAEVQAEDKLAQDKDAGTPWDASVKKIVIAEVEFCVQQFSETDKLKLDYCAKLAALDWNGDAGLKLSMQAQTPDVPPVYIQGELSINGIELLNNQLALSLLEIGSIDVVDINVETLESIGIENIRIAKFSALKRAAKTSPDDAQVVAFDQLNIKPLKLSKFNDLSLGTIELTGAGAYLFINKDGRMDFAQWLPEKQQSAKQEVAPIAQNEAKPFHFSFNEFVFISKQHFTFTDESLKETFIVDVHDLDLRLTQLDSKVPGQESHIVLALSIGEHGRFNLDAEITPLSDRPSVKGTGAIAGMDLRMVAPMTKQHIGHNVKSGQLDVDLKLDVDKGVIDSNMGLALHQFVLEMLSKEESEKLNSEFGFPLNSSLSLLRDRDNTIRLDIPVSGDIESPEFDPKDAIVQATSTAITAAVIQYYTPFGLIFAAESLFDLATALSFDPVLFNAGETALNATHKDQLDKLAALVVERPGIHLTLCGISNGADKDKLFPVPVKAVDSAQKQQVPVEPVPLSKENMASLKQLAALRSANTKNYLVNEKAVEASRLIECSPEYMGDEIAGVEISI